MVKITPQTVSIGISEHRLCTRCGTCIGICPVTAISFDSDMYPVLDKQRCIDCGLCADACPGGKVSYAGLTRQVFGHQQIAQGFDGHVREAWVAHASDPAIHERGAGGGVITGLLAGLLESGQIAACLVTRMQQDMPWRGEPFIARSTAELMASQSSRYMIIPLNSLIAELRKIPGKVAVAALPCQVHGLRNAMRTAPDLAEKIHVILGLFCGGSLEPYLVTELLEARHINKEQMSGFSFRGGDWPGQMQATLRDGQVRPLHYSNYKDGAYNYLISLYMPVRCQTCIDGSNEFADISVGDAWTRNQQGEYKFKGYSKVLVRSEQGAAVLATALEGGVLHGQCLSEDISYQTQKMQTKRKGINAPVRIARWKKGGLPVPEYDKPTPIATLKEQMIERLVTGLLAMGKYRWMRLPILRFVTSSGAIPLIIFRQWLKKRKYRSPAR